MIHKALKRDIDNLVDGKQLWDLATYLINYGREETGDTESVFMHAFSKLINQGWRAAQHL